MGRDKAMLELDGQPLWRHQIETLLALCPAKILIAARHGQRFEGLPADVDVVPDETEGAGALPALLRLLSDPLPQLPRLVTAVDMPAIGSHFLQRNFLQACAVTGAVLVDQAGKIQPFPCLLTPECLPPARELVARNELSLRAFCRASIAAGALRVVPVSQEDEARLTSLNSLEDWQRFRESR